jgi:Xaa-Pro aminopeptidase
VADDLLIYGDTERNAALRHELPLAIGDPLLFGIVDGRRHVMTSVLERDRIAAVAPDVELHELDELGFGELRESGISVSDDPGEGFQFSLGHGVGLQVHEAPSLGQLGHEPLVAGDVIAVEPGLWDRELGGVRFEDLLLVTDDGCETLTDYTYDLAP